MTWKEMSHRRIAEVLAANPTVTDRGELRKLISDAYPFGLRENYPYKAWLQAVKETFATPVQHGIKRVCSTEDYGNMPLFGGDA